MPLAPRSNASKRTKHRIKNHQLIRFPGNKIVDNNRTLFMCSGECSCWGTFHGPWMGWLPNNEFEDK